MGVSVQAKSETTFFPGYAQLVQTKGIEEDTWQDQEWKELAQTIDQSVIDTAFTHQNTVKDLLEKVLVMREKPITGCVVTSREKRLLREYKLN